MQTITPPHPRRATAPRSLTGLVLAATAAANLLTAAEIATNYRLTDYRTREPFRLHDLAGAVILLDFFTPGCTYCGQAIPRIESELVDRFTAEGGNADGLPVIVLYINEGGDADAFIATNGMERVADDDLYRTVFRGLWDLPPPGVVPYYVVINGVSNATTHAPWQIVGRFQYSNSIPTLRAAIDSVAGTLPPRFSAVNLSTNGTLTAAFRAQKGRTNRVESTADGTHWTTRARLAGTNILWFHDPEPALDPRRFYRIRIE